MLRTEISEAVNIMLLKNWGMHFYKCHMKVLHWDTDLYSSFSDLKVETVVTVTKHLDTANSWIAFCICYS